MATSAEADPATESSSARAVFFVVVVAVWGNCRCVQCAVIKMRRYQVGQVRGTYRRLHQSANTRLLGALEATRMNDDGR